MKHYVGLDVSLEETSVAVISESGRVVHEGKAFSEPDALVSYISGCGFAVERIGLEAGPLSQWLCEGMRVAGLPVVCLETRQVKAALSAQKNKTDRKDAVGIAQIVRTGWYQEVHVKSRSAQEMRVLLSNRRLLLSQRVDIDNELRGVLRNFGLKIGKVAKGKFAERVRELVSGEPTLVAVIEPMLAVREVLVAQYAKLHKTLLACVRCDADCLRSMTVPGVGPVTALAYKAGVDDPRRFRSSQAVGAHFGMTPRCYQSGEIDRNGRISKCGDEMVRTSLFEAAGTLLTRVKQSSSLRDWGLRLAKRRGLGKAKIAVARRLAVILHRMWIDGTEFQAQPEILALKGLKIAA
jgi:transposase